MPKKNHSLLTTCYFLLLATFCYLLLATPAKAQDFSLSISPPLLEIMLQPDKSITQAYEVKNEGNQLLYLTAFISPFLPDPQTGKVLYEQNQPSILPQPQFSLNNANLNLGETFILQPNESQQLVLKIKASKNVAEKDYYATLFIAQSVTGRQLLNQTAAQFSGQIGSHLLITVSQAGEFDFIGRIAQFKPLPKIADLGEKINFNLIVANEGQTLFKTNGKIEIFDWLGKKKKEILLRPDNILVDSQRKITCLDEPCYFSSLLPGRYQTMVTIFNPFQSFSSDGGPDTQSTIGDSSEVERSEALSQTISFWIIPFKLILVVIIAIFMGRLVLDRKKKKL